MIARPPIDRAPRVLLDLDFSQGEPLVVGSAGQGSATGQAFSANDLRDFTLDAEVGLVEGGEQDRYGLFFRQTGDEHYAACTINPGGKLAVGLVDGGPPLVVAEATLDDTTQFRSGIGAVNRVSVVVCGPTAACLVNGVAVVGVILDSRYTTGRVGALVVHTSPASAARVVVNWAQARAIFTDAT